MASIFGHALVAVSLGTSFTKAFRKSKFWTLGILCAIVPDADVIGFNYGIPYGSMFGHRGFSHSLFFALLLAVFVTAIFYRKQIFTTKGMYYILFFFLCTSSHGILDAMTTGGKGVAFFSPFDTTRYFFPWRPIKVSPIGIARFFSDRGIKVLLNELIWIGIPSIIFMCSIFFFKKSFKNKRNGK